MSSELQGPPMDGAADGRAPMLPVRSEEPAGDGGPSESAKIRPTADENDISVLIVDEGTDGETGQHWWDAEIYVGIYGNPDPVSLYLDQSMDPEVWMDEQDFIWSPAARAALLAQLPKRQRTKPMMKTVGGQDIMRDEVIRHLTDANDPPVLFRRGGEISEIRRNERGVPSAKLVDANRMRDRMGEVIDWSNADGTKLTKAPSDLASIMLVTPEFHLPPLDAVVEHPVLGRAGRIRTRRGYDLDSATYFSPSRPIGRLDPSDVPHRLALIWLNDLLQDFGFASHADKTNVLALLLTPVIRPFIEGQVPLCAIRATKAGTGKSLLAKAVFTILNGRVPPTFSLTKDDEDEADKRMTSVLLAAEDIVFFDNVPSGTVLRSAALARALTTPMYQARIIRTSKAPVVPVRCTWVATGNSLTMSDEITRRSYLIELTTEDEHPELRAPSSFAHPDLLEWVQEWRPQLLECTLALVQHWITQGRPIHRDGPSLGSFEEWSRVVGSILRTCGLSDFLGNEERKREIAEDESGNERAILLHTIHDLVGGREWTIQDLHAMVSPDLAAAAAPFLPERMNWSDAQAPSKLGNAMRAMVDDIRDGLCLVHVKRSNKGRVYRIRAIG